MSAPRTPSLPPLDYESKVPRPPGRVAPPNPPAALAMMLAFFNVIWLFVAVIIAWESESDAYWLPLPGVVISSGLAVVLALRGRRDAVRTIALVINIGCFALAAIVSGVLLVRK